MPARAAATPPIPDDTLAPSLSLLAHPRIKPARRHATLLDSKARRQPAPPATSPPLSPASTQSSSQPARLCRRLNRPRAIRREMVDPEAAKQTALEVVPAAPKFPGANSMAAAASTPDSAIDVVGIVGGCELETRHTRRNCADSLVLFDPLSCAVMWWIPSPSRLFFYWLGKHSFHDFSSMDSLSESPAPVFEVGALLKAVRGLDPDQIVKSHYGDDPCTMRRGVFPIHGRLAAITLRVNPSHDTTHYVDVWVMKEYGIVESWTRIHSSAIRFEAAFTKFLGMFLSRDGEAVERLFFQLKMGIVVSYDCSMGTLSEHVTPDSSPSRWTTKKHDGYDGSWACWKTIGLASYVETLEPIDLDCNEDECTI